MNHTITLVYNTTHYVYKFRMNLIARLQQEGYRVVVLSPKDAYVQKLHDRGIEHYPIPMSQYGMNPFENIKTFIALYRALKELNPLCSLHYTIKPNTFGNLAARGCGVPVINNIAGAGRAFSLKNTLLGTFFKGLYRLGLQKSHWVFFQNEEDRTLFQHHRIINSENHSRLPGSGVDLERFHPTDLPNGVKRFLFVGRLLKAKGISLFLEAAHEVLKMHKEVVFEVVGEYETREEYLEEEALKTLLAHSNIHYLGALSPDEMPHKIAQSHCVVLPSYYREGVPRSLLEAAAMARPIITTDNVGCRDVVMDGVNGFLVPTHSKEALTQAMVKFLTLNEVEQSAMGRAGRDYIKTHFNEEIVLKAYCDVIKGLRH